MRNGGTQRRGPGRIGSIVFGACGVRFVDEARHLDGLLDRFVVVKMQRRHSMNVQTFEQQVVEMTGRMIERDLRGLRIARQRREVDLRVCVIRREFDALDRDEPDARVFHVAHDEFGQIALNLIGDR